MNKTLQSIFLLIWGVVCLSFGWTIVGYFTIAVAVIVFIASFAQKKQTDTKTEQTENNKAIVVEMERISRDETELLSKKNIYKFREYSNYWKENDINYYKEVYEPILEGTRKKNKKIVIIILVLMTLAVVSIFVWVLSVLPPASNK